MKKKEKLGCTLGLLALFTTWPIWYYLLFQILVKVEATELMWFLFWVYMPFSLFISIMGKIIENISNETNQD